MSFSDIRTGASAARKTHNVDVMTSASLEVQSVDSTAPGPTIYHVVYTRGGWIWRTSHRYRDWWNLKEKLQAVFGTRNLPNDRLFPKKEDLGTMLSKVLTSCQGCHESNGPMGLLEQRKRGFQAYFSDLLTNHRDTWDSSEDIQLFFFPGAPTSYSAALAKQRSEKLIEEKIKEKEKAKTTLGSIRSKLGSIFESSPTSAPSSNTSDEASTPKMAKTSNFEANEALSVLGKISSKMPSFREILFDTPPKTPTHFGSSSRHSSSSSTYSPRPETSSLFFAASSTSVLPGIKTRSESGATDPEGMSDSGGSRMDESIRE